MILADSSAWIEYLRQTNSPAHLALRSLVAGDELITTDVVVMEVLAGARGDEDEARLAALLGLATRIPVATVDWTLAARLQRLCRAQGIVIRRLNDCLIAAVAIRADATVLHRDRDFDALARHTPLRAQTG